MTEENKNEIVLLKIRSLIIDKEMVVAEANRDLAAGGAWQRDYHAYLREIDGEIKALLPTD